MKKVLVIGGGSIGERHTRCFQKTGRAEVILCEPGAEVRQRVATTYGLARSHADLQEALQQPYDAAVICAPSHLHIGIASQLIDQRIPTLIEKPLSVAMDGVAELMQQVQTTGVKVAVGYVHRCNPALTAMREALISGRYGPPVQVFVATGQHFPFYRPAYRQIYYTSHAHGGGAIQDSLTHMMNASEWLVGPVTKLVADADHCVLEGVTVEDTVHVITRHGQIMGSFSLNQHQPVDETSVTIVCQRGMVRTELHNRRWMSSSEPGGSWNIEQTYQYERDDLFIWQANMFLDFLEDKSPPCCPLAEGLQTLRVNHAILESVNTGRWVQVPQ